MNLKDEFSTPQWLFDMMNEDFHFDLDAAASKENTKCPIYLTKEIDALSVPWDIPLSDVHGVLQRVRTVWLNPPYSDPGPWLAKAYEESQKGLIVVTLLPVDTSTNWWHTWVTKACRIMMLKGRLKFSGQGPARWPSAIVIFRPHCIESKTYLGWNGQGPIPDRPPDEIQTSHGHGPNSPFLYWWDPKKGMLRW